mgnify:CR=1 FL=1
MIKTLSIATIFTMLWISTISLAQSQTQPPPSSSHAETIRNNLTQDNSSRSSNWGHIGHDSFGDGPVENPLDLTPDNNTGVNKDELNNKINAIKRCPKEPCT